MVDYSDSVETFSGQVDAAVIGRGHSASLSMLKRMSTKTEIAPSDGVYLGTTCRFYGKSTHLVDVRPRPGHIVEEGGRAWSVVAVSESPVLERTTLDCVLLELDDELAQSADLLELTRMLDGELTEYPRVVPFAMGVNVWVFDGQSKVQIAANRREDGSLTIFVDAYDGRDLQPDDAIRVDGETYVAQAVTKSTVGALTVVDARVAEGLLSEI